MADRYGVVFVDKPLIAFVDMQIDFFGRLFGHFRQPSHHLGGDGMVDQPFSLGGKCDASVFRDAVSRYAERLFDDQLQVGMVAAGGQDDFQSGFGGAAQHADRVGGQQAVFVE